MPLRKSRQLKPVKDSLTIELSTRLANHVYAVCENEALSLEEYFEELIELDIESYDEPEEVESQPVLEVRHNTITDSLKGLMVWLDNNCHNDFAYRFRELIQCFTQGRAMPPARNTTLAQLDAAERDKIMQKTIQA